MRIALHLSALLLLACQVTVDHDSPEPPPEPVVAPPTPETHFAGRVDFDTASGAVDADLTLRIDPGTGAEAAFLISGALDIAQVSGEAVSGWDAAPMEEGDSWDRLTVHLDPARDEGPLEIRFLYSGVPPMPKSRINQIGPDWVEVSVDSAWHPIPEALDEEFTIDLELGLPAGWTVVTPGEARSIDGGYAIRNEVPHGDIVFLAAPDLEVAEGDGAAVYHRGAASGTTAAILSAATTCREYLDGRFGASGGLPDGRFVIPDRTESGYARKNFIALTQVDASDEQGLTRFLCHELAHFWSSGADWLTVDNWLNEGFAVLVAAQAIREIYGEEAWQALVDKWAEHSEGQPSVWTPGDLERRPYAVNYQKGPLALAKLEQRIGQLAFDRVVLRYMTDSVNDTPTLLAVIEDEAGIEARDWFEELLGRPAERTDRQ